MANLTGSWNPAAPSTTVKRASRAVRRAWVRQADLSADKPLTEREEQQRQAVERFTHWTTRDDWDALMRELFVRVVDGCPFAVGLFTHEVNRGSRRLRAMLNYNGGQDKALDYVARRFKLRHYQHIAESLEGLEPHERYDLYKIVSRGMGLPLYSLVYRIAHFVDPDCKAIVVFGGERLGGQMETHLKFAAGVLEQPTKTRASGSAPAPEESRYGELIAALRAADPRKLRQSGLDEERWTEVRKIVTGLSAIQDRFPQVLKAKFALLSKLVDDPPPVAEPWGPHSRA